MYHEISSARRAYDTDVNFGGRLNDELRIPETGAVLICMMMIVGCLLLFGKCFDARSWDDLTWVAMLLRQGTELYELDLLAILDF